jgi:hypothetical protein
MNRLFITTVLLLFFLVIQAIPAAAKNEWQGCGSVTEIPVSECEALIALYNSTNGPKWKNNKGWLQKNTPCRWHGVHCRSGNVQELSQGSNLLSGEIPSELGQLSSLVRLHLSNNRLSGTIPATLGNLLDIKTIWMGGNQLSGEIPSALGNLSFLLSLHIENNRLSGSIPAALGNLSDLDSLWLSKNRLSGSIPPELGKLSSLKSLLLNDNRLSGSIPPELGNLTSLETVSLSNNQLSGEIPPAFGRLSTLKTLSLDNNRLSGSIPAALGNLASLERLSLGNNKLTGEIPKEMGKLSSLKKITTYNNKLNDKVSWTLTVNSSGVEGWAPTIGVPITAIPSKYSGHTSYSVSNIPIGTLIHLKAPASTGIWPWKKNLVSWTGCDFMFGRTCTVKMLANKTVTANYDPDAEALPESCDAMDIVLENQEELNIVYTLTKYDPIGRSGEYVGDRNGVRIPESVTITTKAEELRAVEWRSKADIPIYVVITAEKCDGSTRREVHQIGLGGMIQEDSTPFSDMKARVTVRVTSSLSDAEKNELRSIF